MKDRTTFGNPPSEGICEDAGSLVMPMMKDVALGFGTVDLAYHFPSGYRWPLAARVRQALRDQEKHLRAGRAVKVRIGPTETLYASQNGWKVVPG